MEIHTNGEYNPCQLNSTETTNLSPDGKVLSKSKSLMLNLRGETPKKVWKAYQELKKLIDNKEDKPEKKTKNNPGKKEKQAKKEQKKDNPGVCSKCSEMLIEKSGIASKTGRPYHFWGCSNWPICNYTKPFLSKEEKKRLENAPCDEDLVIEER